MTRPNRHKLGGLSLVVLLLTATGPASADLFGRDSATMTESTAPAVPETSAETTAEAAVDPVAALFTAEALVEAMPLVWRGTFAWNDGAAYFVEMEIVKLTVRPDGDIAFNAETRWTPFELNARMSGRIDPATLSVRIWEIADDASADQFESDGAYLGAFAGDLWDIRAQWETAGTGETGSLVLIADSQPVAQP